MTKEKRQALYEEAKNYYDNKGGLPAGTEEEVESLGSEDEMDALDILVGKLCLPEYGGPETAKSFLGMLGASEEEIRSIMLDCFDIYY